MEIPPKGTINPASPSPAPDDPVNKIPKRKKSSESESQGIYRGSGVTSSFVEKIGPPSRKNIKLDNQQSSTERLGDVRKVESSDYLVGSESDVSDQEEIIEDFVDSDAEEQVCVASFSSTESLHYCAYNEDEQEVFRMLEPDQRECFITLTPEQRESFLGFDLEERDFLLKLNVVERGIYFTLGEAEKIRLTSFEGNELNFYLSLENSDLRHRFASLSSGEREGIVLLPKHEQKDVLSLDQNFREAFLFLQRAADQDGDFSLKSVADFLQLERTKPDYPSALLIFYALIHRQNAGVDELGKEIFSAIEVLGAFEDSDGVLVVGEDDFFLEHKASEIIKVAKGAFGVTATHFHDALKELLGGKTEEVILHLRKQHYRKGYMDIIKQKRSSLDE